MPWKELRKVESRKRFINDILESKKSFKDTCNEYGITIRADEICLEIIALSSFATHIITITASILRAVIIEIVFDGC